MSTYIKASPKARQIFFLMMILCGALAVAIYRLDESLPPLSKNVVEAMDQVLGRSFAAALILSGVNVALSGVAIYLALKTAHYMQWPPKGMGMPFRTKVVEIKNKKNAWLYLAAILCLFAFQAVSPWVRYVTQRTQFEKLRKTIQEVPNKALSPTPESFALLHAASAARAS